MPFARPTLQTLVEQIQEDLRSRLGLVAPLLRRAAVFVFGRVIAGAVHMLHGHLEYLSRQIFPDQSDAEYLFRQAALFTLTLKPAEYAAGTITATGTDGAAIPADKVLQRADGIEYVVTVGATIAGGTADIEVEAVLAGVDANCDVATTLIFESPISGVDASIAVGEGEITDGSDEETIDALRSRLLARLAQAPHGGAAFDYVAWALEVQGVTRAWCYPLEGGAGHVVVRFVRDGDASLIPDAGEVAAVQAHIDALRPVTAVVTVSAPIADAVDLTISITPDTPEIRVAVAVELADLFLRDAIPGGTIRHSRLLMAIGTADGVQDCALTVPAGDSTHATGHIGILGTITWV